MDVRFYCSETELAQHRALDYSEVYRRREAAGEETPTAKPEYDIWHHTRPNEWQYCYIGGFQLHWDGKLAMPYFVVDSSVAFNEHTPLLEVLSQKEHCAIVTHMRMTFIQRGDENHIGRYDLLSDTHQPAVRDDQPVRAFRAEVYRRTVGGCDLLFDTLYHLLCPHVAWQAPARELAYMQAYVTAIQVAGNAEGALEWGFTPMHT